MVNDFGTIRLPHIDIVKVAGLTTAEAEEAIQRAYVPGYYRSVNVIVVTEDGEFFVGGEVKNEGALPMAGEVTLTQAIIMAGGFTDYARKTKVELKRGRNITVYDWEDISNGEAEDPILKNGDTINVPRRWM